MKFSKKGIFIALFAVLYLCVGLVSTIHAVSFFGLANAPVLAVILAVTFEIGQAAVLFNLLTSPDQRKKIMPWALMCILTLVQVLGNIFSSYKYLITNSNENLRFFKEPIFVWTDLPDNITTVIVTYIVGAILPIVALCLTEMVVSYLHNEDTKKDEEPKDDIQKQINHVDSNPDKYDTEEDDESNEGEDETQLITITAKDIDDANEKLIREYEEHKQKIEQETPKNDKQDTVEMNETKDDKSEDPINDKSITDAVDTLIDGNIKMPVQKKPSHFINI